jgi:hypothetical protein
MFNMIRIFGETGGGEIIPLLIILAISILMIASMWKLFTKAGKPGWASIIPIYNLIVMLQIVNKPIWLIILFIIPFVGWIMGILLCYWLAVSFGKGIGYTIGMIFLPIIFYPLLAFSSDTQYTGGA